MTAPLTVTASLQAPDVDLSTPTLTLYRHTFDVAHASGSFPGTTTTTTTTSTTPTPTTVPTSGPTLVDLEDTAADPDNGDQSFDDWSNATGQEADVENALPQSLSGYRCVVLDLNQSLADGDRAELTSFLQGGGTVIALGDHSDGDGFDNADAALNGLANPLGLGLSLNDDSNDQGDTVTTNVDSSPLTAGVSSIGYNWASSVAISGSAREIVASADDSYSLIGAQSVDGGTFVMSGDSNAFTDNNDGFYTDDDNGVLVSNLCPENYRGGSGLWTAGAGGQVVRVGDVPMAAGCSRHIGQRKTGTSTAGSSCPAGPDGVWTRSLAWRPTRRFGRLALSPPDGRSPGPRRQSLRRATSG